MRLDTEIQYIAAYLVGLAFMAVVGYALGYAFNAIALWFDPGQASRIPEPWIMSYACLFIGAVLEVPQAVLRYLGR